MQGTNIRTLKLSKNRILTCITPTPTGMLSLPTLSKNLATICALAVVLCVAVRISLRLMLSQLSAIPTAQVSS